MLVTYIGHIKWKTGIFSLLHGYTFPKKTYRMKLTNSMRYTEIQADFSRKFSLRELEQVRLAHPIFAEDDVEREYQKVWGADLCGQVSQDDFLVREPVNPVLDRACHRRLTPHILVLPWFPARQRSESAASTPMGGCILAEECQRRSENAREWPE